MPKHSPIIRSVGNMTLVLGLLVGTSPASAAVTAFLDFNADWVTNLDSITTPLGFTFTASERGQIEQNVQDYLEDMYQNFDVQFTTSSPSGNRHRINFGATGSTAYGSAPLDFRNNNANQTQSMYVENFGVFLESGDSRSRQILELSRSLAGTAAHELGHSLGLRHHTAYGTPEITPSNYSNTGGFQNDHIMATGATGLNENERETPRTFSQWSNLLLEAANGLTASPLTLQQEGLSDAPDSPPFAKNLALTFMSISGLNAGLIKGSLSDESDVDVYAFTSVVANARFTAEIYSDDLSTLDQFDTALTLFSTNGLNSTMIAYNDDIRYSNDAFDSGTVREQDSFLLNILLPNPGRYLIAVSSTGNRGGDPGGNYELIVGVTVPEISSTASLAIVFIGLATMLLIRRASNRTAA